MRVAMTTVAACGDGVVQDGVEECDDGNDIDTDGCRNDCTVAQRPMGGQDTVGGMSPPMGGRDVMGGRDMTAGVPSGEHRWYQWRVGMRLPTTS